MKCLSLISIVCALGFSMVAYAVPLMPNAKVQAVNPNGSQGVSCPENRVCGIVINNTDNIATRMETVSNIDMPKTIPAKQAQPYSLALDTSADEWTKPMLYQYPDGGGCYFQFTMYDDNFKVAMTGLGAYSCGSNGTMLHIQKSP